MLKFLSGINCILLGIRLTAVAKETYFDNHMLALPQIAFIRVYAHTNCYNGLSGGRKVALAQCKSIAEGGHQRASYFSPMLAVARNVM